MDRKNYRLIFEGLEEKSNLQKLIIFFHKELKFSENKIRQLLTTPPRTLWRISSIKKGEQLQNALHAMGCRACLEPVIWDSLYPFSISEKHHKLLSKELSKVLRCKANLVLFLIQINSKDPDMLLPSMMGDFKEKIEEYFRESDTVIGIDDNHLVILGFSTDKKGIRQMSNKTKRVLKKLLKEDAFVINIGFSLFPQEGRSLRELISIAEQKRQHSLDSKTTQVEVINSVQEQISLLSEKPQEKLSPLQLCFTQARGKIFKRLLSMDPEIIWLGLSQLSENDQKLFLARMPFNSPLIPELQKRINAPVDPIVGKQTEQHFEAIIHQMELEERLQEREETKKDLLSRLEQTESLPTLPSIAAQIFTIASNPNSSARDITKVISNDPSLTSKLLKLVNSAFFGFPREIATVNQAVVILGTEEIMNLAFGVAASKVFRIKPLEGLYHPKAIWHHCISTGLIAQYLCRSLDEYQKLEIFTAGLLHDFGKIFLIEHFSDPYIQVHNEAQENDIPLFEIEEDKFSLNHAAIGEFLSSHWNMPQSLIQTIGFHHQPFNASSHAQLAAIIGLADYLYYEAISNEEVPVVQSPVPAQLNFGHWSFLNQLFPGLDDRYLQNIKNEVHTLIKNSDALFKVLE